jgi:hypothetical protein
MANQKRDLPFHQSVKPSRRVASQLGAEVAPQKGRERESSQSPSLLEQAKESPPQAASDPIFQARLRESNEAAARWLSQLTKAQRTVGRSPIAQLKWVLKFAQRKREDFFHLSAEETEQLEAEIYAFCHTKDYEPKGGVGPRPARLFAQGIAEIADPVLRGIRQFIAPQGWRFSIGQLSRLVKRNPKRNKIVGVKQAEVPDLVLITTADLIESEGLRIKACARSGCKRFFVKVKRGAYCGKSCSQKARNQRFRTKHHSELTERRHRYYVAQIRRERGDAVARKVKRRAKDAKPT